MPTTPVSTSPSMERVESAGGTTVSFEKSGRGPALVLAHGSFSDHHTNWEFVKPRLNERFTVYAIARRGRGQTPATAGHRLEPDVRVQELPGQAHEGMTTAPDMYVEAVTEFLVGGR